MFHVISDFHGDVGLFIQNIDKCPTYISTVILSGDIGFGFPEFDRSNFEYIMGLFRHKHFYLVQGNHDNADVMNDGSNWTAVTTKVGPKIITADTDTILLIPGAYSYDKHLRVPGISWWPNEEMSQSQLDKISILVNQVNTIVSHDAPLMQYTQFFTEVKPSITNRMLDKIYLELLLYQKKRLWIHGHFHKSYIETKNNVTIIGVDEGQSISIF